MNKKMLFEDFCITMIIGLGFIFIDYTLSLGVLVGFLFSILNYKFIEYRYRNLQVVNKMLYLGSLLGIMILALPLLLAVMLPTYFHWLGVFIGLMINRTRLIIGAFISK